MKIAYLINQYPSVSHSFVRREIQALERHNISVERFSVRPSKEAFTSDEDEAEKLKTTYLIGPELLALSVAIISAAVSMPLGSMKAAVAIIQFGIKSDAGLFRHSIYFLEALALAWWVRQRGVTHIHAHFGTNSATVALMASRVLKGTFSMTVHGPEEFDNTTSIGLAQKVEEAALVVAISSFGMSQLRRLTTVEQWFKIKVVRCGIEKAFYEGESKDLPKENRFLCVGRLSEQKGQITLIEAAAKVKIAGYKFQVVFVGDGDMRQEIEAVAQDLNVSDCIDLVGWKTPTEVRQCIENTRVFILPSYAEGLPVSIMEALVLTRPVISTYIAGIPELVEHGVNGWLLPAGDAEQCANAMISVISKSDQGLLSMGNRGKDKVIEKHDIDNEASKLRAHFLAITR